MPRLQTASAALIVLALSFGGCRGIVQQNESLPVGTCVRQEDGIGTTVVSCTEPHTHRVSAIAESAEACPSETVMFSQPADPDDGLTTTCFLSHSATE